MPLTNFPAGVSSFGIPCTGSGLIPTSSGQYFWVASNGMGSVEQYYTSITAALAQCVANRGDVIILEPGYTETVSTAGGLTVSTAGVTIVGLGNGSLRPTITLSATAATIAISAANVTIKNIITKGSVDELVTVFNVTAANVTLDTVDFYETTSAQTLTFLTTSAAADDLIVQNCTHVQNTAPGSAAAWVSLIGTDRAKILNNSFQITQANSASSFIIQSLTTAPLNVVISGNTIMQLGGSTISAAISLVANTTGMVTYNNVGSTATSQATAISIASCYGAQNFATNAANKNGILVPDADT